jgi:hypothetical protein
MSAIEDKSIVTKKFATNYIDCEYGGNVPRFNNGFMIFEFKCSCGSTDVNCKCINNKKWISTKTVEEFKEMDLPKYGEQIFLPDYITESCRNSYKKE